MPVHPSNFCVENISSLKLSSQNCSLNLNNYIFVSDIFKSNFDFLFKLKIRIMPTIKAIFKKLAVLVTLSKLLKKT